MSFESIHTLIVLITMIRALFNSPLRMVVTLEVYGVTSSAFHSICWIGLRCFHSSIAQGIDFLQLQGQITRSFVTYFRHMPGAVLQAPNDRICDFVILFDWLSTCLCSTICVNAVLHQITECCTRGTRLSLETMFNLAYSL